MRALLKVFVASSVLLATAHAQIQGGGGGAGGSSGGGAVYGPTAAGSAAANPPVLMGGTAAGTSTGNVVNAAVKPASTAAATTDTAVVTQNAYEAASLTSILSAVTSPLAGVSTAQLTTAASSLVAKSSAGNVISISGSGASGSYIMLFNATSAPSDGSVTPLKCWGPLAAAGPFVFSWGTGPVLAMSTGITVVSSSTGCFTKTATNAAFISVEYQ